VSDAVPATTRVVRLAEHPTGVPGASAFDVAERPTPEPGPGEALVRVRYLSVDPYLRGRMRGADGPVYADPLAVGEAITGAAVGRVVASEGAGVEPGDHVVGDLPWADYATAPGPALRRIDPDRAPVTAHLGVLGTTGLTAYFGVREVARPRGGETFVVTGAAGAVGSVAGQIAGLDGARVVGITGSAEKAAFLEDELGFDATVDYTATPDDSYGAALDAVAPDGVDAYFDNVGGPLTDAVFERLTWDARVAVCGQIALYNREGTPTGPRKLSTLLERSATAEGFLVGDFRGRFGDARERLAGWLRRDAIATRETVTEGLANAPEAFCGLFEGANVGKQLVAVDP
jgi:NADPH2:quinone reductase